AEPTAYKRACLVELLGQQRIRGVFVLKLPRLAAIRGVFVLKLPRLAAIRGVFVLKLQRECRAKRGNNKQRYSSFKIKEIEKKEEDSKALITVDTLVDWTDHDDKSDEDITTKDFCMIAGCNSEDAIKEGAANIYNLIIRAILEEANTTGDAKEFALMGVTSEVALTLKTKGGLELLSFDDLYYKLKTLEVDVKGYTTFSSSQSAGPSHSTFVSVTKQQLAYKDFKQIEKLNLEEMDLKWKMAILSVRVHKFKKKARRKIDFDKKESARFNKKKVRCYKCQQRGHFARECRAKRGNNKQRYSSFKIKEIGKKEEDSKALITVDTLVDWTDHDDKSDEDITT
nr:hypothetical protein [Tanacetum cinerariifolium]